LRNPFYYKINTEFILRKMNYKSLVQGHYVAQPNDARLNVARPNVVFTISDPMLPD
jgi:hypothetical protein